MIEVYKTNVQNKKQGKLVKNLILELNPDLKVNFDLEDIDKILRIEGLEVDNNLIFKLLNTHNYYCEVLV